MPRIRSLLCGGLVAASTVLATLPERSLASTMYEGPVAANDIVRIGGLDWAWASPCGAGASSCSTVDLTAQAGYGWRLPTEAEVAATILADPGAFARAFHTGTGSYHGYACAAGWFDANFRHCDPGDLARGMIWNIGRTGYAHDTFAVRSMAAPPPSAPPPVPIPGGLSLLLGATAALVAIRLRSARGVPRRNAP